MEKTSYAIALPTYGGTMPYHGLSYNFDVIGWGFWPLLSKNIKQINIANGFIWTVSNGGLQMAAHH